MDQAWLDAVELELAKLGHTLTSLPLTLEALNALLRDVYVDGAPPQVAALSLVERALLP